MNIRYNFKEDFYNFFQEDSEELEKLSFLLTNPKGDFLHLGANKNSIKTQGLNILENEKNEIYKIIDSIQPKNLEVTKVIYEGFKVKRIFKSRLVEDLVEQIDYNKNKNLVDGNETEMTNDTFYLGPNGGLVYDIKNFNGQVSLNVDMKKLNDFDKWGRNYTSFKDNGILFLEYTKENQEDRSQKYKVYLGLKAPNFDYILKNEWKEEEFSYSKKRKSLYNWFIYNFIDINIQNSKRIIIGAGFSKEEVENQINLLEKNEFQLLDLDRDIYDHQTQKPEFELPIQTDVLTAYRISNNSIYKFIRRDVDSKSDMGLVAGYPWFSQIWTRDELISLKALIENNEINLVKQRLFYYLNLINPETGLLKRLNVEESLESPDGIFWLAKRIFDFIVHLDKNNILDENLSKQDLKNIFSKLESSFNKIIENYWDKKEELLKVKFGDSWMDTINVEFPIDIQVQLLSFTSILSFFAKNIESDEKFKHLNDFEGLLKSKIRKEYFRNNQLYQEKNQNTITSNIFLVYYLYPELFSKEEWEQIIDGALLVLTNSTGLISTLSNKDTNFRENYTGEDNLSYHRGDSWFWINNIAAICLNDLNEKKYRKYISKIIHNSTTDILKQGTLGFASELSSASKLKAEGSIVQCWSTATYLNMINHIFKLKK